MFGPRAKKDASRPSSSQTPRKVDTLDPKGREEARAFDLEADYAVLSAG
uniref:Uncharacterized protein n=1 Tax=Cucumis melo TaxID=3656 RepID=A0A9I9CCT4_CUCME